MKLLITIPHYFHPDGGGKHGSLAKNPQPRAAALTACISSLREVLSGPQHILNIQDHVAEEANQSQRHALEIVICTTQGRHVLDQLPFAPGSFTHLATNAAPELLGFECQRALRDRLGQFDYYCFLEDDLVLHDPWFFIKLAWFDRLVGTFALLQPNRYEAAIEAPALKVYVDGDIRPKLTARFQNRGEQSELMGKVMETPIRFIRPANPHSGCYFLTSEQMAHWAAQSHFLDGDISFVGPLESAATLGVMLTFRVYKPAPENASFLEIQHSGTGFLRQVGHTIPFATGPMVAAMNPRASSAPVTQGVGEAKDLLTGEAWDRITGFFTVEEALAVQSLVRDLPKGAVVVELGTFQGRSSVAIASALPEGGRLHCVDHFEGCLLRPGEARPPREEAVARNLGALRRNLQQFGMQERVDIKISPTHDAASEFSSESIDLLFVDAGHNYEAVRDDLETWYPLLKPGGWLCCDDYEPNWPGVMRAIDETRWAGQLAAPSLWCHQKPSPIQMNRPSNLV